MDDEVKLYTIKEISNELNLTIECVKYRIKKLEITTKRLKHNPVVKFTKKIKYYTESQVELIKNFHEYIKIQKPEYRHELYSINDEYLILESKMNS